MRRILQVLLLIFITSCGTAQNNCDQLYADYINSNGNPATTFALLQKAVACDSTNVEYRLERFNWNRSQGNLKACLNDVEFILSQQEGIYLEITLAAIILKTGNKQLAEEKLLNVYEKLKVKNNLDANEQLYFLIIAKHFNKRMSRKISVCNEQHTPEAGQTYDPGLINRFCEKLNQETTEILLYQLTGIQANL